MASRVHRPTKRPTNERRISARYLILKYASTQPHFDAAEIRRLASRESATCTISRIRQANGLTTYLAFVDFCGKRFQTRNLYIFDVQGHHPAWMHVSSAPWLAYDFCVNSGDVILNEAARPWETGSHRKAGEKGQWEVLASSNTGQGLAEASLGQIPHEVGKAVKTVVDRVERMRREPSASKQDSTHDNESWKTGFEAGFDAGLKAGMKISSSRQESMRISNEDLNRVSTPLSTALNRDIGMNRMMNATATKDTCDLPQFTLSLPPEDNPVSDVSPWDWSMLDAFDCRDPASRDLAESWISPLKL